jgi:hypothetical protein
VLAVPSARAPEVMSAVMGFSITFLGRCGME